MHTTHAERWREELFNVQDRVGLQRE